MSEFDLSLGMPANDFRADLYVFTHYPTIPSSK
jgi:hypothetical protein